MRKILLFTIAIFSGVLSLFAQKQDTIYYNRNWDETTKELAGYYRVEIEIKTEDTTYWSFEDRYIENDQVQNEGFVLKERYEIRQGKWTWYYQNGHMEMTGDYQRNDRVGEWVFNHKNGALKKKGIYSPKGHQDGEWVWYHADSSFMSKATYKEDTLIGQRDWYYPNGKKRISEYFTEGRLDSVRTEWYSTGKMKSQIDYKGGFKNGNEKKWYLNGVLKSDINYSFGIATDEVWYNMEGDTVARDEVVNEKEFHNLLWKITGNGIKKPSYLFGTMHVKDKSAFEFSDAMLEAFNNAEGYSMEIHPDSLYAYSFKEFDRYKSWNHFGTEVIGESDPTSYYDTWSGGYGSYGNWVMNLNQIFHRDEYDPDGMPYFVDCYLYYLATKNGKYTDGIERVIDHVNAGKNLPRNTRQYDILTQFNPAEEMLVTYQEGNLDKINALMEFLQNEEFRYRLLTVRNIKMAEAIDSLAHLRSTFNTAGTAHLPGDDGVIKLLEDKGYTLTPVDAVFSGDSLDPNVANFNTKWRVVKPYKTDFTVNSPGPLTAFSDGVSRNVFLDPIREIGVDAFQLDERWFSTGSKSTKVQKADLDYLFSDPNIFVNEKIIHNGVKGVEIYWTKHDLSSGWNKGDEDVVYNRSRVFKKNFQTYVITVAALNSDSLKGDFANKYITSVKWPELDSKPKTWVEYEDELGAFKVNAPEGAQYKFIHYEKPVSGYADDDTYEHKVHYWFSEEKGNKYIFRYSNSPNRSFFYNDSSVLANQIDYYRDISNKEVDTLYFEYKGVPGIEATINTNKEYVVKIKSFNRGYRHYQLIAQINKDDVDFATDKFFDSFEFKDLESLELKEYTTEDDSVTVMFPELVDKGELASYRWFVPNREAYSSNRNRYSYDWGKKKATRSTYYSYADLLGGGEKAYLNRNKFFGIDTAQGVTYELFTETFSDNFSLPNRDSLMNYYKDIFFNDKDTVIKETRDSIGNIHTLDLLYEAPYENGQGHLRFTQKGQAIVTQRIFYPEELIGNENIELFFSSLDLTAIADTVNIFEDKSEKILDNLMSKDTLEQRTARRVLKFYPFDSTHVASIQRHVLEEIALDTNDIENNTMDLLNLLTYVNDSTTGPFIYNVFSTKNTDSLDFRYNVLKILREVDDELSYKADLELLDDSLDDYYTNYAIYNSVVTHLEDSLQLFADNFDKTDNWTKDTIWVLEADLLALANSSFLDDSVNTDVIIEHKEELLNKYYWAAAIYDSLDSDTSIYLQVRNYMMQHTELMGYLEVAEDSCTQIFLRLLDDKNKDMRLVAAKAVFRGGNSLSEEKKKELFASLDDRYRFMLILEEINNLDEIPAQYRSKQEIAKAQLHYSLIAESDGWGNYQNNRPVKFKLIKEVTDKIDDQNVMFYVFSYYEDGRSREKRVAVSNPLSVKEEKVFFANPSNVTIRYEGAEKNMIKEVIQEWKDNEPLESVETDEGWGDAGSAVEAVMDAVKK